ncbi:hypothetical protein QQS21_002468 [Conoideocrella luteorostrata]|uniref:GPI inositol-deacylase n=1 Tax=Conoideocrella luteorostrata TaxID=1105319 RepID=A0AAJ0FX98_9HYPO|nr:hypothetical protein QQS21_002468 [Conoideocrella luteorostrata]
MAESSTVEDMNTASGSRNGALSLSLGRSLLSALRNRSPRPHRHNRTLSNNNDNLEIELKKIYDPPNPSVNLIFVHGLCGDLEKTWCTKDKEGSFWPRDWLREEETLQDVRVHTFGYTTAFKERDRTALDIDGLGRLLLTELDQSKALGDIPIVFVAHSMGGLVAKQAFLCAHSGVGTSNLYSRIRGMIFLATPHQGSDWPKFVENVLQINSLSRYIKNLSRGSESLMKINEEFERLAHHLQLWSFHELRSTPVPKGSSFKILVVDPSLARINADHRQICKFNSRSDPNYKLVQHAIVTTVKRILDHDAEENGRKKEDQMLKLESLLCLSVSPEKDLESLLLDKVEGSCDWILQHDKYSQWRKAGKSSPAEFWLTGNPGTGKSTLSAHVAKSLQDQREPVCYYFCRTGRERQGAGDLIRHLAFQMAYRYPIVREALIARKQAWETIEQENARLLWKHLFTDVILTLPLGQRQTWIIDGLDESTSVQKSMTFFSNISKGLPLYPINLYLSSRTTHDLRHSAFSDTRIQIAIDPEDTRDDIKRYITAQSQLFRRLGPADEEILRCTLESKADACFLWLKLAISNMEDLGTTTDKKESVEDIPEGLTLLYRKILNQMETKQSDREIGTTRAILTWTAHALRDLNQEELRTAIINDIGKDIDPTMGTVESLCGQLIRVQRNGVLRPAHFTVTEFLRKDGTTSHLAIGSRNAHERIATVCLEYLLGPQFIPPRARQLPVDERAVRSPIADYAATYWSKHVMMASSESDHLAERIHEFLTTNVLSWIEYIARQKKSLYEVIQTAKNLRNYLDRRVKHVSPISSHYSKIDRWITDLLRVSTKFGKNLLLYPSAIHFIAPPLCPKNSSIYTTFSLPVHNGISLKGTSLMDWDDCINYTEYQPSSRPSAVACAQNSFAIGLNSGYVKLFDSTTFQEIASMHHVEPVSAVLFDSLGSRVASASSNTVRLWTVHGELLWLNNFIGGKLFLTFSVWHGSLTAHKEGGQFFSWRTGDGTSLAVPKEISKLEKSTKTVLSSSMNDDLSIIAIAFATGPPQVWSLKTGTRLGKCKMNGASALQILLNPRADLDSLAVAYNSNILATFSTVSQKFIASVKTEAIVLACTPDGLTLATGDRSGNIKFWEFETLQLMYCIASPGDQVCWLTFSHDGLRLFDLRGNRSMVWEPSILVRKNSLDSSTISDSVHGEDVDMPIYNHKERAVVTAMLVVESIGFVIVGKQGGAVCAYDIETGVLSSTLYSHHYLTRIASISFSLGKNYLATMDGSSEVIVKQLQIPPLNSKMPLSANTPVLQLSSRHSGRHPIRQISFSPDGSHLLVCRLLLETICLSEKLDTSCTSDPDTSEISCFTWVKCNDTTPMIIAAESRGTLRLFHHDARKGLTASGLIVELLNHTGQKNELAIKRILCGPDNKCVVVELQKHGKRDPNAPAVLAYRTQDIMVACERKPATGGMTPIKPVAYLMAEKHISLLNYLQKKLVFLDSSLWIRSYDLGNIPADTDIIDLEDATRHMFVSSEIAAASNLVPGGVTRSQSAIFSQRGEIVVIQHALRSSVGDVGA